MRKTLKVPDFMKFTDYGKDNQLQPGLMDKAPPSAAGRVKGMLKVFSRALSYLIKMAAPTVNKEYAN